MPHREFYDYAAKYLEEGTRLLIPAKLTRTQVKKFQEFAVRAFRCLECLGMARVDFFLENRTGQSSERDQHDSRLHFHQHVSETVGGLRLPYRDLLSRLIDFGPLQHREKHRTKYTIELPDGLLLELSKSSVSGLGFDMGTCQSPEESTLHSTCVYSPIADANQKRSIPAAQPGAYQRSGLGRIVPQTPNTNPENRRASLPIEKSEVA